MRKTLTASPEGIQIIKKTLKKKKWSQEFIAGKVGCSRQTIWSLLKGNPIDYEIFMDVCKALENNWEEIVKSAEETNQDENIKIDLLVQKLRETVESDIETRCGTMRILDMTQPIGLSEIYTQVNILEKISGRRRKEIAELLKDSNLEDFDRFSLGRVTEKKIPAKEAVSRHHKLLILGKPGAGKTTFLKHLAIQCNEGQFQENLVPFFVTLKDFAEAEGKPKLLTYLDKDLGKQNQDDLEHIFNQGKALILLDGLDEVLEADSYRVLKEIRDFSTNFPENQYVMTCRIAAKEYTFERFTEVEIADFDWQQITTFANNWFKNKAIKPEKFLERLEQDKAIQELASNPLLLTLLCLAFEESGDFSGNRAGLYKEGLDALLKKWDAKRGIKRDQVYQKLWVQRKEDLLSKIAWDTFAPGDYFFKQDKAERYIGEYIRNLPGASSDEEALRLDSEVVLKSIESQHGLLVERAKNIYSFSHLSFQEYFTGREIILVRQSSDKALEKLVNHIFDKRWREVFFLAVAMSPNAERLVLLMKKKIDLLLAEDNDLQDYLKWLNLKSQQADLKIQREDAETIQEIYEFYADTDFACSKIFFLGLDLEFNLKLNLNLNPYLNLNLNLNLYLYLNPYLNLSLYLYLYLYLYFNSYLYLYLNRNLNLELAKKCDSELYKVLLKLKQRLPEEKNTNYKEFEVWWQEKGPAWSGDFRNTIIKHQNIGHDWQFNDEQKELLKKYYFANQFLTQCLHQECYVSREVRQEIEETLLLPIAEIEKREFGVSS